MLVFIIPKLHGMETGVWNVLRWTETHGWSAKLYMEVAAHVTCKIQMKG